MAHMLWLGVDWLFGWDQYRYPAFGSCYVIFDFMLGIGIGLDQGIGLALAVVADT